MPQTETIPGPQVVPPAAFERQPLWRYVRNLALIVGILWVLIWSALGSDVRIGEFLRGLPAIWQYVSRMVPPNVEYVPKLIGPAVETVQMAIWGTLLGVLMAIPLGILGANNIAPNRAVYAAARFTLNSARGVNELVFALIFVAAVGLGPFAGVLALAIHNAGMLGKFYAEAIEAVDPGPIEAMQASGANALQTIGFAIVPQILPHFIACNLYRLEVSIRSATVLGLVGAGGIGFYLIASMRLFQYQDTAMVLIVILVLVTLADSLSTYLRSKII